MSTQTLFFYKGTAFPMYRAGNSVSVSSETTKVAMDMILLGLKQGVSRETQITDYKTKLDEIEQLLCKHCNPSSEAGLQRFAKIMNDTSDRIYSLWSLNICALLILKVLKHDNENGFLTILSH
jgi:hypothetical protein